MKFPRVLYVQTFEDGQFVEYQDKKVMLDNSDHDDLVAVYRLEYVGHVETKKRVVRESRAKK